MLQTNVVSGVLGVSLSSIPDCPGTPGDCIAQEASDDALERAACRDSPYLP